MTLIYNGKIISSNRPCIFYNDRGFTLGDGLFETILIQHGSIPILNYHWKRLEESAVLLGIPLPFRYSELKEMILHLIECHDLQNTVAGARLTITSGESERGILSPHTTQPNFVIFVFEHKRQLQENYSITTVNIKKNEHNLSSKIKSTSYLDNILAKKEAVRLGYDEALLLNTASMIADASTATVYMIKDKQIFTPPIADGALPGVIRSVLLEEFHHLFPINEQSITLPEILNADEVFLTNALLGIQPVYKLNNKVFTSFSKTNVIRTTFYKEKNYF